MRSDLSLAQHLCGAAVTYCRSLQVLQQAQCPVLPYIRDATRLLRTLTEAPEQFVTLNSLRDNPGATRAVSANGHVLPSAPYLC